MIEPDGTDEFLRTLVLVLDLCGTFAFALSGAMAGVRRRLDLFGVLVLSFAAATFGGIARDLLIGAAPPAALQDWRYLAVSLTAGAIVFFWSSLIEKLRNPVRMLDAMGLALFAVAGTEKALVFGMSPAMAALLGMLTGIGGGVARDVLLAEIPAVLRSDLYAVAALVGAAIVAGGSLLHLPVLITTTAGGLACFGLRVVAIRRGWRLPVAAAGGG
ncbi:trimeric intracellular cation channel family protein [uncultured Brevundimonas sp.]|uniref:trimeric intracellular cation channel family protein n=1 Tax=uncultured Brevundimonas sp. TaxID=213418 RepID=UPI0030EF6664|tara:strand:- start:2961 stop:3608 length:648 start_codon:yes stop_codon:yes gene_type:complete